jgi:soluble lytic murein transglycosylase-like protein
MSDTVSDSTHKLDDSHPFDGGSNTQLNVNALPPNMRDQKTVDAINKAAKETGLDPNLIAAVMWKESRGNKNESSANPDPKIGTDVGRMQISQTTYDDLRKNHPELPALDVNNPEQNILAGAYELKFDGQKSGGNLDKTLGTYVGTGDDSYAPQVESFYYDMLHGIQMPDQDPPPLG